MNKTLRNSEYYGMIPQLDKLYDLSRKNHVFTDLMTLIKSEENIKLAYRNIKNNKGSYTQGTDNQTIRDISLMATEVFVKTIREKMGTYIPRPVKRVEIPKPNGKTRPLGIPSIWDRLIQQCILQILEPICEAKFANSSYGFRANRSAHHAIANCYRLMQRSNLSFVVDIDIKGFFDNVNHSKLIKQMWTMGIQDKHLLGLIRASLRAPIILPNGKIQHPKKGTAQGGVISPLLSNIVLNEFDWWIISQWEEMPTKTKSAKVLDRTAAGKGIDKGNKYKELRKSSLKEVYIVRYADDFKLFCRKRSDAIKLYHASSKWLKERLSLDISDEKSQIVNLKKHYSEFLGFELKLRKKRNKFVVHSHMSKKALRKTQENLKKQLIRIRRPRNSETRESLIRQYNATVVGLHFYYRAATSISEDCNLINQKVRRVIDFKLETSKQGTILNKFQMEQYGKSKQVRWLNKLPILPVSFIKHKKMMSFNQQICKFTDTGRKTIHRLLVFDPSIIIKWMRSPTKSIEFDDNRVSKYSAQRGKCGVLKIVLSMEEIHCHHIIPERNGGTDSYQNLMIVHKDIHTLIHLSEPKRIEKHLSLLQLTTSQIEKINILRLKAGCSVLTI